jgi:hypothetical protein
MIHRRGIDRLGNRLKLDPFHLGMADWIMYRTVLCPWAEASTEQLRYFLGYVHAQIKDPCEDYPPNPLPSRLREY